jgi:serine/threonine protein kinase
MTMQESIEMLAQGGGVLLGAAVMLALSVLIRRPELRTPAVQPRRIGAYALLDKIAAGAMGDVYRARHVSSGRLRALKLLSSAASDRQKAQFDNEVRFGARLSHPNTVSAQEHGQTPDGTRYFTMDLVNGITLQALVEQEGPQSPERVIGMLLQVAAALAEVHELGLVHCDIKPSNLLLCRGAGPDRVKLLDFGLVKHVDEPQPACSTAHAMGTPLYISPEALTSPASMDGRSDLYGLGAVAHFLLSGAPVFSGGSLLEVFSQHLVATPEPLSQLLGWAMPHDLERVVLDCLAKQPDDRPGSAQELIGRLERCMDAELTQRAAGVRRLPNSQGSAEHPVNLERVERAA